MKERALALLMAWLAAAAAAPLLADERSLEIRRHWSLATEQERLAKLGEERRRDLLSQPLPEGTIIMRNWYEKLPDDGRWTPDGAVRNQTVVLFDAKDGTRFAFHQERDYESGIRVYRLTLWREPTKKQVLTIRIEMSPVGHDMKSMVEKAKGEAERGRLQTNEELLLTFDAAGRKWTLPSDEWLTGRIRAEDRAWLDEAVLDARTRELIEGIDLISNGVPELVIACKYFTRPLLGRYNEKCRPAANPLNLLARKPDCSFDASFGEPCSLEQMNEYKRRTEPQLVPTTKPQ